jgi:hypothetical protein
MLEIKVKETNTTEKNKLIVEFMGYSLDDENLNSYRIFKNGIFNYIRLDNLKYNSDWNELMEVVKKCLEIGLEGDKMEMYYNITDSIPDIEGVYNAVVHFIEWHNSVKKMNTTEKNKLIAEFMQPSFKGFATYDYDGMLLTLENLKFHYDWNCLMEVVEKVESLNVVVEIRKNGCYILRSPNNYTSELENSKIEAVYNALVDFIEWYNSTKEI